MSSTEPNRNALIASFESESLQKLAMLGRLSRYVANSVIINEGDEDGALFLIASGRVQVYSIGTNGREYVHGHYIGGEYVGEMSLDGGRRSAFVRTTEATTCFVVPRSALIEHIRDFPEFGLELLQRVILRLRMATDNARDLALAGVYGRVISLLESLAITTEDGTRTLSEQLTQQEIATRVGASREMVSRILKELLEGEYISVSNRRYQLHKQLPRGW